jgi:triacylglycerol lipase
MHLLWFFLSLLSVGFAADVLPLPRLPSEDSFYRPRIDSWKDLPVGTILDARNVTLGTLYPYLPSRAKAYQLLYVTQNVHGEPDATVTTIVVPPNANKNRLLSFQNAYDAPDVDCSPSYGFQFRVDGVAAIWNRGQMSLISRFLVDGGPVINIPDYEGSNASFTVGPQSAYQTLDSIRAALKSNDITGLSPGAKTVMFGYSGGGFATAWATEFHASYSPNLSIVGAAIGGLPINIKNTYTNVNNGNFSELSVLATLGLMSAFPELDEYVREHLTEDAKEAFLYPLKRCSSWEPIPEPSLINANITSFFDNGDQFLDEFNHVVEHVGIIGKRVEKGQAPNFPLLVYQGTNDTVTGPVKDTIALVQKFRNAGTRVLYKPYLKQGHVDALILGMIPAWTWIIQRFENAEAPAAADGLLQDDDKDMVIDDIELGDLANGYNLGDQTFLDGEALMHGYEL